MNIADLAYKISTVEGNLNIITNALNQLRRDLAELKMEKEKKK